MSDPGGSRFHIFPWREEEGFRGQSVVRPTLYVTLHSGDLHTTTKALVDTGAPRCVFPRGTGDALGVTFQSAHLAPTTVVLMGREWPAVTELVRFDLPPFDGLAWEAEADFVLQEGLPFGLLGLEGFLDRWAVSFNAYYGYFVVEPADDFHGRIPPDPFEELQRRYPDQFQP